MVGDDPVEGGDGEGRADERGLDDASVAERLRALHEHLAATAERPVRTDASRWLGEAEAVAADVAGGEAPQAAIETRVRQVRELLSNVDATGDEVADRHVEAARELADSVAADLPGDGDP